MILLLGWPVQSWLDHNAILIASLELQVANPHRLYTAIIVLRFPRIDSISVYPQLLFPTLSFRLCAYRVVPRIQTLQVACKVSNKWFPETCFSRKGINSRKKKIRVSPGRKRVFLEFQCNCFVPFRVCLSAADCGVLENGLRPVG